MPFIDLYFMFKASFSNRSVYTLQYATISFSFADFPKAKAQNLDRRDACEAFCYSLFCLTAAITSLD